MVPGFTGCECRLVEMRRQDLLAAVARERLVVQTPPRRPRERMGRVHRWIATLARSIVLLRASSTRHAT